MANAAADARSEDTASLRHTGIAYLPKDTTTDTIVPAITKDQGKIIRGFNHQFTARLLCPIRFLKDFDAKTKYGSDS
jgi:hypothetical protein